MVMQLPEEWKDSENPIHILYYRVLNAMYDHRYQFMDTPGMAEIHNAVDDEYKNFRNEYPEYEVEYDVAFDPTHNSSAFDPDIIIYHHPVKGIERIPASSWDEYFETEVLQNPDHPRNLILNTTIFSLNIDKKKEE
jgi:hypothetical protein